MTVTHADTTALTPGATVTAATRSARIALDEWT